MTTLNPADKSANITLSNGNLTAAWNGSAGNVRSTTSKSTGKVYFEATHNVMNVVSAMGLANAAYPLTSLTNTANQIYSRLEATAIAGNGTNLGNNGGLLGAGLTGSFAVDLTSLLFWCRIPGGNWNNNASFDPATGAGGISFSYLTGPFFVFAGAQPAPRGSNQHLTLAAARLVSLSRPASRHGTRRRRLRNLSVRWCWRDESRTCKGRA